MPVRGVLFDLDGTLADTLSDLAAAMNRSLVACGLPVHAVDDYRRMIGEGAANLVRRALPPDQAQLHDEVLAGFRREYAAALVVETAPYPGIPATLDACTARGVALAVLSNKPDAPTQTIVDALFGRWRWAQVRGEVAGTARKPDPAGALAIAAATGIAPDEWLFVGDTGIDIETARAARMVPVGAAWGYRPHELARAGADVVLDRPEDLVALLPAC
jgi:phosphoglycolate phosphatase